ncbi:MAG: squalene synthase HpnC [Chlamydiae bacterium]|nr:squalene synthase HpnC [Chlamydiota bacterium]MBI3266554.1 squalene synthase HpnC [Chlamydiota bacterium]
MTVEEAFQYCEALARSHYENFTVVSYLVPRGKRQDLYSVYAFCRWSDDLGDEIGNPQESLRLLNLWLEELNTCLDEKPRHPVFIALRETIRKYDLPLKPFQDLIHAFKMDQEKQHYQDFGELLHYCQHSANPVGRIFLMLFGYRDEERFLLSDATCTALQLTNFWQDIPIDLKKGRIYIPLEDMARFHYCENELATHTFNHSFVRLMKFEIDRSRTLFQKGLGLIPKIRPRVQLDIELFNRGGLSILKAIEQNHYDVFTQRPTLSKFSKGLLAFQSSLHLVKRYLQL